MKNNCNPPENDEGQGNRKKGFWRKTRRGLTAVGTIFVVLLITVTTLLATSITWMFHTWNHLTMNELMYQLNAPMDGTNRNMIMDYIKSCIPLTVFVLAAAVLVFILLREKENFIPDCDGNHACRSCGDHGILSCHDMEPA